MARAPDHLASSIPFLRRYARALTGSQVLGDHYVGISLEMNRDKLGEHASQRDIRRELFRRFHEVWANAAPTAAGDYRAWQLVGRMARPERQLLLLVAFEGCSLAEAAYILGITETEAQRLFRVAQGTAARHAKVPILILEDELLIAMDLEAIVESAGHTVCGIATGEDEALAVAAETRPQLILADVHLKDGQSGVVAVRKILRRLDVPVIFVTGYPQELLTGMSPEPAFVITKPFKADTVIAAVSQALLAELPAEPDAAWRLRGRLPEEADTALHPAARAMPSRASHSCDRSCDGSPEAHNARQSGRDAREDAAHGPLAEAASQGNGYARRASSTQS